MNLPLQAARSILFLVCVYVGRPITAQSVTPAPRSSEQLPIEQIVSNMIRKNLERAQALSAFDGTRVYHLEYRGFPGSRSAEMIVDVKYRSSVTKTFTVRSSGGSKLLIETVFNKLLQSEQEALTEENQSRAALNDENYSFTLAGQENTPTGSYYILAVEPRTKNKLLYRGRIWVDATDFAVERIEAAPAKNPSFWIKDTKIEHVYIKVGDFWLPTSNRSTSNTRLGGRALLTIEYTNYKVTGVLARINSNETVAGSR